MDIIAAFVSFFILLAAWMFAPGNEQAKTVLKERQQTAFHSADVQEARARA